MTELPKPSFADVVVALSGFDIVELDVIRFVIDDLHPRQEPVKGRVQRDYILETRRRVLHALERLIADDPRLGRGGR